jgi:hypothetical protein
VCKKCIENVGVSQDVSVRNASTDVFVRNTTGNVSLENVSKDMSTRNAGEFLGKFYRDTPLNGFIVSHACVCMGHNKAI